MTSILSDRIGRIGNLGHVFSYTGLRQTEKINFLPSDMKTTELIFRGGKYKIASSL